MIQTVNQGEGSRGWITISIRAERKEKRLPAFLNRRVAGSRRRSVKNGGVGKVAGDERDSPLTGPLERQAGEMILCVGYWRTYLISIIRNSFPSGAGPNISIM